MYKCEKNYIMPIYLISGYTDLTQDEFIENYVPQIRLVIKIDPKAHFIISDHKGCDVLANEFLNLIRADAVVYHKKLHPSRNPGNFPSLAMSGIVNSKHRDKIMVKFSTHDIMWFRSQTKSGKAKGGHGSSRMNRIIELRNKT